MRMKLKPFHNHCICTSQPKLWYRCDFENANLLWGSCSSAIFDMFQRHFDDSIMYIHVYFVCSFEWYCLRWTEEKKTHSPLAKSIFVKRKRVRAKNETSYHFIFMLFILLINVHMAAKKKNNLFSTWNAYVYNGKMW